MALSEALLPEFDQEMANTRRTLERVPDGKFDWKPHAKSPTMGWLATHIATLPGWVLYTLEQDSIDLDPPGGAPPPQPEAKSRAELLEKFDRSVSQARAAIAGVSDQRMLESWSLLKRGQNLLTLPRAAVLRSFVMNHSIHHRAQLTVYLRLNDVPVPALYGPSADEQPL